MTMEFSPVFGVSAIRDADPSGRFGAEWAEARRVEIAGHHSRDWRSFYAEVARVLGFPSYFGKNLNALIDCMRDEYCTSTSPLLLWISNAQSLLADEQAEELHALLRTLTYIAEEWWEGIPSIAVDAPYRRRLLVVLDYSGH